VGAGDDDPDRKAAALAERHDDRPASRWGSRWIDVAIWGFAVGATAMTLWYSLGPTPPGHGSDKQLHGAAYFVNTLAILFAIVWRPGRRGGRRFEGGALPVVVGMLVLGGLIEIVQGGFVDRESQFTDWVADSLGIMLALMLFVTFRHSYQRSAEVVDE
jgi:VanZ family protein